MERLSAENLPICCTSVSPGLNPPTITESSSFSISLSAAHSADKVLDSLQCSFFSFFSSSCKKKQQLKSALQNQCHPHICGFQSQLDSNSLTAAVVDAVVSEHLCSKAEGGSMASQAGGLLCA